MIRKIGFIGAFMLLIASLSFAGDLTWSSDFDAASAQAKESGKYMLIDFTGSDWCPWCFKLRDEVFSQKAFQDYAAKDLVLMVADFPRRKVISSDVKQQNETLLRRFGIKGFPTLVLLNPQGELVAKTGYQEGGAEQYVAHLKDLIKSYESKQKETTKEK